MTNGRRWANDRRRAIAGQVYPVCNAVYGDFNGRVTQVTDVDLVLIAVNGDFVDGSQRSTFEARSMARLLPAAAHADWPVAVALVAGRRWPVERRANASATVIAAMTSPDSPEGRDLSWAREGAAFIPLSTTAGASLLLRLSFRAMFRRVSDASSQLIVLLVIASAMSTIKTTPIPIPVTIRPSISVSESDVAEYPCLVRVSCAGPFG